MNIYVTKVDDVLTPTKCLNHNYPFVINNWLNKIVRNCYFLYSNKKTTTYQTNILRKVINNFTRIKLVNSIITNKILHSPYYQNIHKSS